MQVGSRAIQTLGRTIVANSAGGGEGETWAMIFVRLTWKVEEDSWRNVRLSGVVWHPHSVCTDPLEGRVELQRALEGVCIAGRCWGAAAGAQLPSHLISILAGVDAPSSCSSLWPTTLRSIAAQVHTPFNPSIRRLRLRKLIHLFLLVPERQSRPNTHPSISHATEV